MHSLEKLRGYWEVLSSFKNVEWVKTYPIDSLQIYFAGSLEIQEELINYGFNVPKSLNGKIKTPIPIIYSNFRGWLKPSEPITIERLIPPEWLGILPRELKWKKTRKDGKEAYKLPKEEVYVDVGIAKNSVIFNLIIKGYHLERTSIRGVNPEKWSNWAMFYISLDYINELINILKKYLPPKINPLMLGKVTKPKKEVQQGGKEVTYYLEVPVKDFSLCMGCFSLVQRYLHVKAREHGIQNPDVVISKLRLRLKYDPFTNTFAKVGVAKISGKQPQIMVKIASKKPKEIKGVLKQKVKGKARGKLIYCNHKESTQYVILDLIGFYNALTSVKNYVSKLPED